MFHLTAKPELMECWNRRSCVDFSSPDDGTHEHLGSPTLNFLPLGFARDVTKLLETNTNLRTQIKQRVGECLEELEIEELRRLEDEMENTFKLLRERKFKSLGNQIEITKKKNKSHQDIQKNLIHELELIAEDPQYGLVDNGGDYDSVLGYQIEGSRAYALCFNQNHHHHYLNNAACASDIVTFHLLE